MIKRIDDLGASAYLLMHGYKVSGRDRRAIVFEVSREESMEFDKRTMEYLSSEFHRFDSCLMSLKKLGEYAITVESYKKVTDLGAGAYLLMHKHRIVGRQGRAIYFEVDPDKAKEADDCLFAYLSSEYHRFDHCLMSLKKIEEYVAE